MVNEVGLFCVPYSVNLLMVMVFMFYMMGVIENVGLYVEFFIEPIEYYLW